MTWFHVHDGTAVWLFKRYLSSLIEAVVKASVAVPTELSRSKECLILFPPIVTYLLKRFPTLENIIAVYLDVSYFDQSSLKETVYVQKV